jgi:RNA polymerase sigma-70 factor (ECF subfamily)
VDDITIQLARQADRDAQSRLLRAMQDHWFRFCLSQLRDPDNAADAVQETALRVLTSLSRFDGRSSFKTWSFGIALNVCRESRRRRIGVELDSAPEPSTSPSALDDQLSFLDDSTALRRVLAELPDRQREVVTCRFFEEMSVADTASAMNCAEGTVKATLFAALRALRTRLGGVVK